MLGRDESKIVSIGDTVFNQADSRLYTLTKIQGNIFTCEDYVTKESKIFDIRGTTFTKVKNT